MRLRKTACGVALLVASSACQTGTGTTGSPPPAPAAAHRGGVLKVGITAPGGVDPLDAYEPAGKLISTTMCDTIVSLDPVTGQVREALARGWVNPDGTNLTLKLRQGVRFSNGTELTSKDVDYSLQQLVAPANGAYTAGLGQQFAALSVADQTDVLADPNKAPSVAQAVTKFDAQVFSRTPDGGALRSFAEPAMAPISRAAYDKDPASFAHDPVCVGPYVLAHPYRPGDRLIVLKRSKHYYGKNVGYTGGGRGYVDEIDFRVYPSAAAALAGYRRGEVDVVQVPRQLVATTTDTGSRVFGPATAVEYVGLPGGSSTPFGDPDVRIALSEAIDRTRLVADVFGPAAQPANGFEPPALAISDGGSLEGRSTKGAPLATCGSSTPARPDLAAAEAHLAAAAKKPGATPLKSFTLEVNDDAPYPAMARELAAQWHAALGLDVKVQTVPWDSYVTQASGSEGFTSAFRIRWSTDATSPTTSSNDQQSFLSALFGASDGTVGNWAHYSDRPFEFGLTDDAAGLTDVAQRGIAFARLAGILCRQMPLIPVTFDRPAFLVRSTVLGSARPVPVGRDGVLLLRELYRR